MKLFPATPIYIVSNSRAPKRLRLNYGQKSGIVLFSRFAIPGNITPAQFNTEFTTRRYHNRTNCRLRKLYRFTYRCRIIRARCISQSSFSATHARSTLPHKRIRHSHSRCTILRSNFGKWARARYVLFRSVHVFGARSNYRDTRSFRRRRRK